MGEQPITDYCRHHVALSTKLQQQLLQIEQQIPIPKKVISYVFNAVNHVTYINNNQCWISPMAVFPTRQFRALIVHSPNQENTVKLKLIKSIFDLHQCHQRLLPHVERVIPRLIITTDKDLIKLVDRYMHCLINLCVQLMKVHIYKIDASLVLPSAWFEEYGKAAFFVPPNRLFLSPIDAPDEKEIIKWSETFSKLADMEKVC